MVSCAKMEGELGKGKNSSKKGNKSEKIVEFFKDCRRPWFKQYLTEYFSLWQQSAWFSLRHKHKHKHKHNGSEGAHSISMSLSTPWWGRPGHKHKRKHKQNKTFLFPLCLCLCLCQERVPSSKHKGKSAILFYCFEEVWDRKNRQLSILRMPTCYR